MWSRFGRTRPVFLWTPYTPRTDQWAVSCHLSDLVSSIRVNLFGTQKPFLGALVKLRKTTISFVMSVRPHGTTGLPLKRLSWNLMFRALLENLSRIFKFHYNLTRIKGTLREGLCTFMIIFRCIVLRIRNGSDKSCRGNQNTLYSIIFSRKSRRFCDNVEKYGTARRVTGHR